MVREKEEDEMKHSLYKRIKDYLYYQGISFQPVEYLIILAIVIIIIKLYPIRYEMIETFMTPLKEVPFGQFLLNLWIIAIFLKHKGGKR